MGDGERPITDGRPYQDFGNSSRCGKRRYLLETCHKILHKDEELGCETLASDPSRVPGRGIALLTTGLVLEAVTAVSFG